MAMTMDQRNHHLGGMGYEHMSYGNGPSFTNPWSAGSTSHHTPSLFPNGMGPNNAGFDTLAKQHASPTNTTTSLPYTSVPASAPSLGAGSGYSSYGSSQLLDMSQDLLNQPRTSTYEQGYSAAPSSIGTYAPTSAPYVNAYGSVAQPQQQDEMRRLSHS